MKTFLIYPHQLFRDTAPLKGCEVVLVEEPLFFTQYRFHMQKLILHRASMQFYADYLRERGFKVHYMEVGEGLEAFTDHQVCLYDVADDWLMRSIKKQFSNLTILPSPNFLNVTDETKYMHQFYIHRRKEMGIFVDDGKPFGGKWSLDSENRKKLPKEMKLPPWIGFENPYVVEAKNYVKRFESVGSDEHFYYPTTFEEADMLMEYFFKEHYAKFGDYQDAVITEDSPLFHSLLSSSLNIGLIDLGALIDKAVKSDAPYNAKEGFVRQIIGWREFMHTIYGDIAVKQRTTNYFGFTNTMPEKISEAKCGIDPLDRVIEKVRENAYANHIERLMILGNLFLLLEIDPDEVYTFFMRHFIDAYDWVMVGNVYGMSQYADGGLITTKPYVASSNYIRKMSNYKKGEWCEIWDGLYWRFLYTHQQKFAYNNRMKMQLSLLERMSNEKLQKHIKVAENYIQTLWER